MDVLRVVTAVSVLLVAQALTQLHFVALPRIRGIGGEKLVTLLQLIIVVIIVQEFVIAMLLLDVDASKDTVLVPKLAKASLLLNDDAPRHARTQRTRTILSLSLSLSSFVCLSGHTATLRCRRDSCTV